MQRIDYHFEGNQISWVVDSAHNPSGMTRAFKEFSHTLNKSTYICLVIGSSPQNEIDDYLKPIVDLCTEFKVVGIIITEPYGGRYSPINAEELARDLNVRLNGIKLIVAKQPKLVIEAINRLLKRHNQIAKKRWQVFCVGSLYLAGNILFELGMADFEQLAI